MKRYGYGPSHEAEGSIAKVFGVIFVIIGGYALLTFYKVISFQIQVVTSEQLFLMCAMASVIGGLYMLVKGGSRR